MGRFDYPSPYWDSVGDPALDLIDRMLTVDVDKRITVDECLEHPWTTQRDFTSLTDSTDGLTGAMGQLDFAKRKVKRERTLLSSINDIKVSKVIELDADGHPEGMNEPVQVKVWEKNPEGKNIRASPGKKEVDGRENNQGIQEKPKEVVTKEEDPAAHRAPEEFVQMGGKGDVQLFGDDLSSRYLPEEVPHPQ